MPKLALLVRLEAKPGKQADRTGRRSGPEEYVASQLTADTSSAMRSHRRMPK